MRINDTRGFDKDPKLCFAKPGDVVSIDGAFYLLCVTNNGKRPAPAQASNGLYSDERDLFLVDFATGNRHPLPHLSTRVEIHRNAELLVKKER